MPDEILKEFNNRHLGFEGTGVPAFWVTHGSFLKVVRKVTLNVVALINSTLKVTCIITLNVGP